MCAGFKGTPVIEQHISQNLTMPAPRRATAPRAAAVASRFVVARAGMGWNKQDAAVLNDGVATMVRQGLPSMLFTWGACRLRFDLDPHGQARLAEAREAAVVVDDAFEDVTMQEGQPDEAGSAAPRAPGKVHPPAAATHPKPQPVAPAVVSSTEEEELSGEIGRLRAKEAVRREAKQRQRRARRAREAAKKAEEATDSAAVAQAAAAKAAAHATPNTSVFSPTYPPAGGSARFVFDASAATSPAAVPAFGAVAVGGGGVFGKGNPATVFVPKWDETVEVRKAEARLLEEITVANCTNARRDGLGACSSRSTIFPGDSYAHGRREVMVFGRSTAALMTETVLGAKLHDALHREGGLTKKSFAQLLIELAKPPGFAPGVGP